MNRLVIDLVNDHHVEVVDPYGCITIEKDWIKVNCTHNQTRPEIILKIPEIMNTINPKMIIRTQFSGGWNELKILKNSHNRWITIFDTESCCSFTKEYTIYLDTKCYEYKIVPIDGGGIYEYIKIFRSVVIEYQTQKTQLPPPPLLLIGGVAATLGILAYFSSHKV